MRFFTILWLTIFLFCAPSGFAQKNLNVYVFIAEECPISIYMARPLRVAADQFGDQADFYAVFPSIKSTEATTRHFLDQYQLADFKSILDPQQELTRRLGATITPEVVITNAQTGDILYRGRISNAWAAPGKMRHGARTNDLVEVLTRIGQGETVARPWPAAVGCYITPYDKIR